MGLIGFNSSIILHKKKSFKNKDTVFLLLNENIVKSSKQLNVK